MFLSKCACDLNAGLATIGGEKNNNVAVMPAHLFLLQAQKSNPSNRRKTENNIRRFQGEEVLTGLRSSSDFGFARFATLQSPPASGGLTRPEVPRLAANLATQN